MGKALKIFKESITTFSGSNFCEQKVDQAEVIRKEVERNLKQW